MLSYDMNSSKAPPPLQARFARIEGDALCFYDIHQRLHADFGPAVIKTDGEKRYYQHGEKHRRVGASTKRANGDTE